MSQGVRGNVGEPGLTHDPRDRISEAADGNPLFLRELLASVRESGRIDRSAGVWRLTGPLGTTPRLTELLQDRLSTTDPEEREALELVAVGQPLPLAVAVGLVDFSISAVVLFGLMAYYGIAPTPGIWSLPLFTILAVTTAVAVSLWLAALNVRYRDVRYTVPFLTQLWLFVTPVAYPTTLVRDPWWRAWYSVNPMVGVVDGFRWALLGGPWPGATIFASTAAVLVILASGLFYFRRTERTFADVV